MYNAFYYQSVKYIHDKRFLSIVHHVFIFSTFLGVKLRIALQSYFMLELKQFSSISVMLLMVIPTTKA